VQHWTPVSELTPGIVGGWIMRSRGRGDLGWITAEGEGRKTVYKCAGRAGSDLGTAPTLAEAARRLWEQTP
jgi:hypothetical protein